MSNFPPTIQKDEQGGHNFRRHVHVQHWKGILVMLGFTVFQFFFMSHIVGAGELTVKTLLNCTNLLRFEHELPNELLMNEKLTMAAETKLEDMIKYKYWAHRNPITGKEPWDFVDEAGYYYETTGENLAYGFTDSQKICNAWAESPKHLANIANESYQEIGFAVNKANLHKNEKGILVVQMFGSRNDFHAAGTESGDQNRREAETGAFPDNTGQSADGAAPEVKGTAVSQTSGGSAREDSVHPAESPAKTLMQYAMGILLAGSAVAAAGTLKFKKNRKKTIILKAVALGCASVAAILALLFFFAPL
jgi:hypothetical protein